MKTSGHNKFTRKHSKIKGAEVAAKPRTHAAEEATEDVRRQNPQRMDILRRHTLSTRNNNDTNEY